MENKKHKTCLILDEDLNDFIVDMKKKMPEMQVSKNKLICDSVRIAKAYIENDDNVITLFDYYKNKNK